MRIFIQNIYFTAGIKADESWVCTNPQIFRGCLLPPHSGGVLLLHQHHLHLHQCDGVLRSHRSDGQVSPSRQPFIQRGGAAQREHGLREEWVCVFNNCPRKSKTNQLIFTTKDTFLWNRSCTHRNFCLLIAGHQTATFLLFLYYKAEYLNFLFSHFLKL